MADNLAGEVTELLRRMIRNACVNDGTPGSGHEDRNVEVLRDYLDRPGLELETYEAISGRSSLVARMEGRRKGSSSLVLLGHTDVVPANEEDWRHDPFAADLEDGEVWGRGAVDMLNLTASMAVAFGRLADGGFRPEADLLFIGVADEEGLGTYGAEWLTEHVPEYVRGDYLVTEAGGFPLGAPDSPRLPVVTAEKGTWWCTLTIRGTPGHASQPLRTDSALVKAAEVVRRLAEHENPAEIHDIWRRFVEGIGLPDEVTAELVDPDRVGSFCEELPALGLARQAHACTHTTMAPTVMTAGTKVNVIPDRVRLQVDIRVLPGWGRENVESMLAEALGDLAPEVDVTWHSTDEATASPTETPLWDALERVARRSYPEARCIPFITAGATDARFFRRIGCVAYGFGLFSRRMTFEDYARMFHGVDERVDIESLELSTHLWDGVARDLVG
jgi:acetylornithine deacetylase/succinyl-diaminopimelate desuccinylase-like protein